MPMHEHSYLTHLLSQARKQGLDLTFVYASLGINADDVMQQRLTPDMQATLYQRILFLAQDEYFGMLGGGQVPNGTFRMLCYSVIHAPTLERAIRRTSEFHELCRGMQVKPELQRRGRSAQVSLQATQASEQSLAQLLEAETPLRVATLLSMWHNFISWLVGCRIPLTGVSFSFPRPDNIAELQQLLLCPLSFAQPTTKLRFPALYLDYPLVQTDDSLRTFLKTAPYPLLSPRIQGGTLRGRVEAMLGQDFSRALPDARMMAERLNISVSTLRRRLLEEGCSYQQIKDECRRNAALIYLDAPQLSLAEVASLTGFSEPSAFFRAFRKWTGSTPSDYRQRARNVPT